MSESKAKRKVIVAGRRVGKTTVVADIAVLKALEGRRVLEAAPTSYQTQAFWEKCKSYVDDLIAAGVVYKNETERILEFPNGGRIKTKTAWDADSLRGDYADLLILDEYSFMRPNAWTQVGAPMLLDNNGDAIFIFTPNRKNHAFALYSRAVGDDTGRWRSFRFSSLENPYLSAEALREITEDMTDGDYRQEILAEFLDNEGAVFTNIAAAMNAPDNATPFDHNTHRMVIGIDWGKRKDYTAVSVGCLDCMQEVYRDRFRHVDYPDQIERVQGIFDRWSAKRILAEENSIGDVLIDYLRRQNYPVVGFKTTSKSKHSLVTNLRLAIEDGGEKQWQFINDPIWNAELEAFEEVGTATGYPRYAAPENVHDDTVIARGLMVMNAYESVGGKRVRARARV